MPILKIRVGADYGPAMKRKVIVPTTGYEAEEIASDALNRAVKLEQSANPGEFVIGRALYELIHVQWLARCEEIEFDSSEVGVTDYQAYVVR